MRIPMLFLFLLAIAGCASSRLPALRGIPQPRMGNTGSFVDYTDAQYRLAQGDREFRRGEYEKARATYELAAGEAIRAQEDGTATEACAQVARMYSIQGKFEEGRPWLAKAKFYATPRNPLGWSRYVGVRGRFEWQDEKDSEKAKQTFIEMFEFCKAHGQFERTLDAAHMVAIVGTPDEKVEWALNAIATAEEAGEEGWLASIWNNLGWTYEERGEYSKMLDALLRARAYHYKFGRDEHKLIADFGVGRAYWRNNDNATAREWIEKAFELAKQRHASDPEDTEKGEWVGWGHIYLADILDSEGSKAEALESYKAGRPYIVKAGIETWWPEQLQKLDAKIAELEGSGG